MASSLTAASALKLVTTTGPKKLLLGRSYPCHVPKAAKVFVKIMDWDDWLRMYFYRYDAYYAHDPTGITKTGDLVLIEELPKRLTRDITHAVQRVVYPCGDITDPLTGRKCMGGKFRDEEERIDKLWGKNEKSFNYDKAPPRGWQEGKKDTTDKLPQRKFHEFNDRDTSHLSHI